MLFDALHFRGCFAEDLRSTVGGVSLNFVVLGLEVANFLGIATLMLLVRRVLMPVDFCIMY